MDSLNLSGWDVLQLMEQWACKKSASMSSFSLATPHARKPASLQCETVLTIRAQIVKDIQAGLSMHPALHVIYMMADMAFSMGYKHQVQETSQDELHQLQYEHSPSSQVQYCWLDGQIH
jgi:hypothetical protein